VLSDNQQKINHLLSWTQQQNHRRLASLLKQPNAGVIASLSNRQNLFWRSQHTVHVVFPIGSLTKISMLKPDSFHYFPTSIDMN
jgi:hypothetical protein